MKFDYMPDMIADSEFQVNKEIDYSLVQEHAKELNTVKKRSSNLKVKSIKKVLDQVTEKVGSDTLSEKFLTEEYKIPIKSRQDYIIQALAETKQRLSFYQSICNGLA